MVEVRRTQMTMISAMKPAAMDRDVNAMAVSKVAMMRCHMNTIVMSEVVMAAIMMATEIM
jgi:hypothetical protein